MSADLFRSAVTATVLSTARPSEPPICCMAFSTPEPIPESRSPTPWTAVSVIGTNTNPMPNDIIRIQGSRSFAYDAWTVKVVVS